MRIRNIVRDGGRWINASLEFNRKNRVLFQFSLWSKSVRNVPVATMN